MFNLMEFELGVVFMALWVVSVIVLWFSVDRKSRPGPIRSVPMIEGMMLVSIMSLLLGISLCIRGYGLLE